MTDADSHRAPDPNPPHQPQLSLGWGRDSSREPQATSHEDRATSHEPRATRRDHTATHGHAFDDVARSSETSPSAPASREAPRSAWDVVVVGGGVGGLAVAALLAKAGRAVLVLEASAQVGGSCLGATPDGYRYDLGVGPITGVGPGGALSALCDRLQISLPAVACDPALQIALPRHRVDLSRSTDDWWPEIRREFPDDEEAWHELVSDLASLARDREELARRLPPLPPDGWLDRFRCWRKLTLQRAAGVARPATRTLQAAAARPFHEALADYGLGAPSRQALEACLWFLALRGADECSTLEAALVLQHLRGGLAVAPRGPAALAELLAGQLRTLGGEVRLLTKAERCVAERGRIAGVTTAAGETIRARRVVADVPPGVLMGDLVPAARGVLRRHQPGPDAWEPRRVAQLMGVAIPTGCLPSALGHHCLVVVDPGRPARDENLVVVRRMTDGPTDGATGELARLCVGRFVPPAVADAGTVTRSLLDALDQVIPGVEDVAVHRWLAPAAALAELWGRPMGAVRYAAESRAWLGRRGLSHRVGWPGLFAVGDWTYPGRLLADVVEGALHVADLIAAEA